MVDLQTTTDIRKAKRACGAGVPLFDIAARRAGAASGGTDYTFAHFHQFTGCVLFSIDHGLHPNKFQYVRDLGLGDRPPTLTLWNGKIPTK